MSYLSEFEDQLEIFNISLRFAQALRTLGWEDTSWHLNTCPSWRHSKHGLTLWIDADLPHRHKDTYKYTVCATDDHLSGIIRFKTNSDHEIAYHIFMLGN